MAIYIYKNGGMCDFTHTCTYRDAHIHTCKVYALVREMKIFILKHSHSHVQCFSDKEQKDL